MVRKSLPPLAAVTPYKVRSLAIHDESIVLKVDVDQQPLAAIAATAYPPASYEAGGFRG